AFMTKGLVGLFPLAAFGIKQISLKSHGWKKSLQWSLLATFSFLTFFGLTLLLEPARSCWVRYFDTQLFATFEGARAVQDHIEGLPRYYMLLRMGTELFNPLLLLVLLCLPSLFRPVSTEKTTTYWPQISFFTLIALSATLPLL